MVKKKMQTCGGIHLPPLEFPVELKESKDPPTPMIQGREGLKSYHWVLGQESIGKLLEQDQLQIGTRMKDHENTSLPFTLGTVHTTQHGEREKEQEEEKQLCSNSCSVSGYRFLGRGKVRGRLQMSYSVFQSSPAHFISFNDGSTYTRPPSFLPGMTRLLGFLLPRSGGDIFNP